jgi:hypothetical protein
MSPLNDGGTDSQALRFDGTKLQAVAGVAAIKNVSAATAAFARGAAGKAKGSSRGSSINRKLQRGIFEVSRATVGAYEVIEVWC